MGAGNLTKGKAGEREAAQLLTTITGRPVTRRVRNHAGDSDLVGLEPWTVEIKRHRSASRATVDGWWEQAVRQTPKGHRPLLLYRVDRGGWRAVWSPVAEPHHQVEADPLTWWAVSGRRTWTASS
jgi:hypothetical protein